MTPLLWLPLLVVLRSATSDSLGGLTASLISISLNYDNLIMYEYTIKKSRYGLYTSVLTDGTAMVTGLTEDAVRLVTDTIHIPVLRGDYDGFTSIMGKAVVDGKL